jgi:succinate dehydrogenase / fumarate reductase cytochrome b subunit
MHYIPKTGMIAWLLHRISGAALAFYLPLHIYVTSSMHDPAKFDKVMAFVNQPLFKIAEVALLGAVVYHALNGFRVLIIDWFGGTKIHSKVFYILVVVGAIIFVAGAIPLLLHAYHGLTPEVIPSGEVAYAQ